MNRERSPGKPWTWGEVVFVILLLILYIVLPMIAAVVVVLTWCGEAGC